MTIDEALQLKDGDFVLLCATDTSPEQVASVYDTDNDESFEYPFLSVNVMEYQRRPFNPEFPTVIDDGDREVHLDQVLRKLTVDEVLDISVPLALGGAVTYYVNMSDWTNDEIAEDIVANCEFHAMFTFDQLLPHVARWRQTQAIKEVTNEHA